VIHSRDEEDYGREGGGGTKSKFTKYQSKFSFIIIIIVFPKNHSRDIAGVGLTHNIKSPENQP